MDCYVVGGVYRDENSGIEFFSLVTDELHIPVCDASWQDLFSRTREFGHIYVLSECGKKVQLKVASEIAETCQIRAPRTAVLKRHDKAKALVARERLFSS